MKKISLYIYIAAYLALLIPTPGRFVYGFTIMLELTLLMLTGTLINSLVSKLKLDELRNVIIMCVLIAFTVLYRQIFVITQTEVAITLGFIFYLPTVSLFIMGNLFTDTQDSLSVRLKSNMKHAGVFALTGILFFLFRDVVSYGTFTFYGKNHHIYEKVLLNENRTGIFTFLGTIPGAFVLCAIALFLFVIIRQKFNIFKNWEVQK